MLSYESALKLRKDIIAGRYAAPTTFEVVDPKLVRPKRSISKTIQPDDFCNEQWDEEAFEDNFYDEYYEEEDVTPDYFRNCAVLDTTYFCDSDWDVNLPSAPLFQGSPYSAKDLARFLLSFKARHLKVGDGILANMVAIMATFLPPGNPLTQCLPERPSTYLLLKTLDNLAHFKTQLRCLKIDSCLKKCMGFYGINSDLNFCSICGACRWKLCTSTCYEGGLQLCDHTTSPKQCIYYNVVQDRLVKLLKSDLKNLFHYHHHRAGIEL